MFGLEWVLMGEWVLIRRSTVVVLAIHCVLWNIHVHEILHILCMYYGISVYMY